MMKTGDIIHALMRSNLDSQCAIRPTIIFLLVSTSAIAPGQAFCTGVCSDVQVSNQGASATGCGTSVGEANYLDVPHTVVSIASRTFLP